MRGAPLRALLLAVSSVLIPTALPADPTATVPAPATADSLRVGQPAPGVYLQTLDGQDFFLSDHCGQKLRRPWQKGEKHVVVLSFWATWCKHCPAEMSFLQKLQEDHAADGLRVFLVNVSEKKETVQDFVRKNGIRLPVLLDRFGVVAGQYGAKSLPRLAVVDREGNIACLRRGWKPKEEEASALRAEIESALKAK
jgi:thiol-disulfide isomerase/thioredoxin